MDNTLFLIGLMGSGKTTVGRKLANQLDFRFIDVDQELINRTGVSISHIFEVEGEQGFRDRESKLLEELADSNGCVVSTGGGIVLREENRNIMQQHGTVIYLDVPVSVLWRRLRDCQRRPLLQVDDPYSKIVELRNERHEMYISAADVHLKVSSDSALRTAKKIQKLLGQPNQLPAEK